MVFLTISSKYYGVSIDITVFLMYNISKIKRNLMEAAAHENIK